MFKTFIHAKSSLKWKKILVLIVTYIVNRTQQRLDEGLHRKSRWCLSTGWMVFCLRNVTYLLDITPNYPLSLWPPPIPLHVIQVNTLVAKQLPISHDKRSGRGCFRNNAWHTIAWGIPYSRKLSREKTFANFTVMWLFAKVFSAKFGGAVSFGLAKASNRENLFFTNSWKFSPSKVSRDTVLSTMVCHVLFHT